MGIKVIIFDLDNTLYDEYQYILGAYKDISLFIERAFGIKKSLFFKSLVEEFNKKGSQYPHLFDSVLKKFDIYSEKLTNQLLHIYSIARPKIKLYPDTRVILSRLKRNYKLGLITNGNIDTQRNKVKLLKVTDIFSNITYARKYGNNYEKPSSRSYLEMLKYLKIKGHQAVYVGDNPFNDFIGAKQLGIKTIRLKRGEFSHVVLAQEQEADFSISNLNQIFKLLK